MIKIILTMLSLIFMISCHTKVKNNTALESTNISVVNNNNKINIDTLPYNYWYETQVLTDVDNVTQIKIMDDIENKLSQQISIFKDSLLSSIDTTNLVKAIGYNNKIDYSDLVRKAIVNGNKYAYCDVIIYFPYSYDLYMGEKYNFAPAYFYVFNKLDELNQKNMKEKGLTHTRQDMFSLDYVSKNQRDLALYSLIKGYKNGYISNSRPLAIYFRDGIYFPKDIPTANKLDSIYKNQPPSIYPME